MDKAKEDENLQIAIKDCKKLKKIICKLEYALNNKESSYSNKQSSIIMVVALNNMVKKLFDDIQNAIKENYGG